MTDLIRYSETLQKFFKENGFTKKEVLETAKQNPGIVSAEYNKGLLTIVTTVDPVPIIIEVELKD